MPACLSSSCPCSSSGSSEGAIAQTAGGGRLALHFAAARGAPPEAVQLLCDAFAAGAAHADADLATISERRTPCSVCFLSSLAALSSPAT